MVYGLVDRPLERQMGLGMVCDYEDTHDSTYVAKSRKNNLKIVNQFHVMRSHDLLQEHGGHRSRSCALRFEEEIAVILEVEAQIIKQRRPRRTFFRLTLTISHESGEIEGNPSSHLGKV